MAPGSESRCPAADHEETVVVEVAEAAREVAVEAVTDEEGATKTGMYPMMSSPRRRRRIPFPFSSEIS